MAHAKKNEKYTDLNTTLSGKWYHENEWNSNSIYHAEYNFKNDGNVEIDGKVLDSDTRNLLGYLSRTTGNYKINGDSLIFFNLKSFHKADYSLAQPGELVQASNDGRYAVKLSFNPEKDRVTIIYAPCPPNANCIGSQQLFRSK